MRGCAEAGVRRRLRRPPPAPGDLETARGEDGPPQAEAILTAGAGQYQMHAAQLWPFDRPRAWATSGGLGSSGFALPAALGAKAARPGELVIAVAGDACFEMSCAELATSVAAGLPVVVAILNDWHPGTVRRPQETLPGNLSERRPGCALPDYVRMAESYGCVGLRAERPQEVDEVVREALAARDRTVVLDFHGAHSSRVLAASRLSPAPTLDE